MNLLKHIITRYILIVVCSCLSISAIAQNQKAKFVSRFPFTLVNGGFIIIEARLPGISGYLKFMLDTGSSGVSLDSSTAAELGLVPEDSEQKLRGLGEIKSLKFVYNKQLELPNVTLDGLNFHINDYRFFKETYGTSINGVIGYPLFKNYIVKVDYNLREIEIWKPGKMNYNGDGYTFYPSINGIPYLDASIKDNKAIGGNYLFDTGADICVLLCDKYVTDSNVVRDGKKSIDIMTAGLGGKQQMKLTTLDEINVGPYAFKKVPSVIYNDVVNVTKYPASVGIIGIEFLRRFNITFNYPAGEIHLVPNDNYREPFHYGYTGFEMYNYNDRVVVDHVIKGSPAEKAGLQVNDVILGVQNTFTNNIEDYKKVLSAATKMVELHVQRGTMINNVKVQVDSVL